MHHNISDERAKTVPHPGQTWISTLVRSSEIHCAGASSNRAMNCATTNSCDFGAFGHRHGAPPFDRPAPAGYFDTTTTSRTGFTLIERNPAKAGGGVVRGRF